MLLKLFGAPGPMIPGGRRRTRSSAALTLRLPKPRTQTERRPVGPRGRVPSLTLPAIGAVGMRAASGFLLFLMAFALRSRRPPAWWFAVLAGSAVAGGFLADLVAPRFPRDRSRGGDGGRVLGAGRIGARRVRVVTLPVLAVFAVVAGAATEFARLAFQA